MVASFLLPYDLSEPIRYLRIGSPLTQQAAQVMFGHTKEACAHLAIGSQTKAVAMAAKRLTHWGNDADFGTSISENPPFGCGGRVFRLNWAKAKPSPEAFDDFASRHD